MSRDPGDVRLLRELHARLVAGGAFGRSPKLYARRIATTVALWIATFVFLYVGPDATRMLACLASGLASVELGMLGHDAGHRHIHRDRRLNDFWGYVGMAIICGQNFGYWRWRHDLHHRNTHVEGRDPDLDYDITLSVYEQAALAKRGIARWLRPFQAYYFWPIGALYVWALRWDSLVALRGGPHATRWDRWGLLAHYVLWLVLPSWWVGPGAAVIAYVAVSTVLSLLLVALFAPNHIGMATAPADAPPRSLAQRLASARNIRNPAWLAYFFGGLDAHIEHHLFPSIVTPRLRRARTIMRALCHEHGLSYREQTFFEAHREVLVFLMRMAHVTDDPRRPHEAPQRLHG